MLAMHVHDCMSAYQVQRPAVLVVGIRLAVPAPAGDCWRRARHAALAAAAGMFAASAWRRQQAWTHAEARCSAAGACRARQGEQLLRGLPAGCQVVSDGLLARTRRSQAEGAQGLKPCNVVAHPSGSSACTECGLTASCLPDCSLAEESTHNCKRAPRCQRARSSSSCV